MITPQELRDIATEDHLRGCEGRKFACTCGYEGKVEQMLRAAAKRIEELEATNRGYRELEALRRETEEREKDHEKAGTPQHGKIEAYKARPEG